MRIKRKKSFRRILQFYRVGFKIIEPYRVLLDGTFIEAARRLKIDIRDQLPKTLLGRATPVVTSCIMDELRSFRGNLVQSVLIAKHFFRHKCSHAVKKTEIETAHLVNNEKDENKTTHVSIEEQSCVTQPKNYTNDIPTSGLQCILDLIGKTNPHHYIVATQDKSLKHQLRQIPGVPILSIVGPGPMLEPPSQISEKEHENREDKKRSAPEWEKNHLPSLRPNEIIPVKKRKRKGKHPLSCLKKKQNNTQLEGCATLNESSLQRQKKRGGISSSHPKDEINENIQYHKKQKLN